MEGIVADLERAGLLEVDGEACTLTAEGAALARLISMGRTDEADAVLEGLLGDAEVAAPDG